MKRMWIVLAVLLGLAAPAFAQQETLIIGVLAAPEADGGTNAGDALRGAELAARAINEAGGTTADDGTVYRLRVISEEAAMAADAAKAVERLAANGAAVIIGFPNNAMIPAALPETSPPLLLLSSGADGGLWGSAPMVFGARGHDATLAEAAAQFAIDELSAESLATVVARAEYGYAAENGARDAIAAQGAELAVTLDHDPQASDFTNVAAQIAEQDPDALIVWNSPAALRALLAALEAENWRGEVLYGYPEGALDVATPAGIDLYGVAPWAASDDSEDFIDLYTDEYNQAPTAHSAIAYDAVYLAAAALAAVGGQPADIRAWLADDAAYTGVQGEYGPRNGQGELIRAAAIVEIAAGRMNETARYSLGPSEADDATTEDDTTASADDGEAVVRNGATALNLRAQPNATAAVLLTIPAESEFVAFARNDATPDQPWIAVTVDGRSGWVIESALFVESGSLADLPSSAQAFG